jgi:hypothetical protein
MRTPAIRAACTNVTDHPDLHVVDEQRHPLRLAGILDDARNAQPKHGFHGHYLDWDAVRAR